MSHMATGFGVTTWTCQKNRSRRKRCLSCVHEAVAGALIGYHLSYLCHRGTIPVGNLIPASLSPAIDTGATTSVSLSSYDDTHRSASMTLFSRPLNVVSEPASPMKFSPPACLPAISLIINAIVPVLHFQTEKSNCRSGRTLLNISHLPRPFLDFQLTRKIVNVIAS